MTVRAPNRTYVFPTLLVDELVRAGVRDACVMPGSRSAPLAFALAGHPGLRAWSHVDERCGGYFALGLAKATRRPVVVACTSGTAAANLLPAVVEAYHAGVPLVVLTADRPPELRDCAAGQTIDQLRLFGTHVRWFVEVGTPEASAAAARHARTLACRAVATAAGPPAGPVHLNCPFREPLVPEPVPGDVPPEFDAVVPRPGDAPWARVAAGRLTPAPEAIVAVAGVLAGARRPVLVCGPLDDPDPELPAAVAALAEALGAPVLAEVTSNLRRAPLAPHLVDAHEAVLRTPEHVGGNAPDAIVRLGAPPTSRTLATYLAQHVAVPQVVVDATGTWPEPAGVASHLVRGEPAATCTALAAALGRGHGDGEWSGRWRRAGSTARAALRAAVLREDEPFEAHAALALAATLPAGATLYAGNSMAVRALDAFWPADAPPVRVLANRGANGIDGFVSSVLGAAAGGRSIAGSLTGPVAGVCGDLSLYHDLNGLLAVRRHGLRAVLLVLDNDGGGIFDFLPVARFREGYEEFFVTPHGLDFAPAVEMYGAAFVRVTRPDALVEALAQALAAAGTTVIDLRFTRAASVAAHARAWASARAALTPPA